MTALTALKQIDREVEPVAASLRQPSLRVFRPSDGADLPAILEIFVYLFVHAMTTVSAVVFYSANTALASVAVLNMDDAGDIAPAAAMGMVIFTDIAAGLLHMALSRGVLIRTQALARRAVVTSATRSAGSSSARLLHCSTHLLATDC